MTDISATTGYAKLKPRARLISLIGEELISDEPVALVELVKNSYDADASNVKVAFEGNDPERPDRIIVSDDGIGMNLDTVLNVWFEPGTPAKRQTNVSPKGRLYQGAKGIGRFAAARLAERLILETKPKGTKEAVLVLIDWGSFDEDSYLEDISIEYQTYSDETEPGTRLIMEGIRGLWTELNYQNLYDRLSRLISPFDEILDFTITLDIPGYPEYSGEVQPPDIILKPRYMLRGELDGNGVFSGEFLLEERTQRAWGKDWWTKQKKSSDQLDTNFTLEDALKLGGRGTTPLSGGFGVEIRAWDRDREGLEPYVAQYSKGIQEIRRILTRYSGVSIYRDGFRVYPYGQSGNDWLNLDNRSRQSPTLRLANNQIVAAIRISREQNPLLIDRSNREGMVINDAHIALEDWFREALSILEEQRYRVRPRSKSSEPSPQASSLFEVFDLTATVNRARDTFGSENPFVPELEQVADDIEKGVERIQEVFSRLLMSAGLGHMVDMVVHEIGRPLGSLNRRLIMLQKQIENICNDDGTLSKHIQAMKSSLEDIHNLRERLNPHTPAKRGRAEVFNVFDEVQNNFDLYESIIEKQGITYTISPQNTTLQVRMARSSLGQILANLIDNSVFWIVREKGVGKGGQIQVTVSEVNGGFRILFADDGPGVSPEDQTNIGSVKKLV